MRIYTIKGIDIFVERSLLVSLTSFEISVEQVSGMYVSLIYSLM